MTNGDRIKSMSNEELAKFVYENSTCNLCIYKFSPCRGKKCEEGLLKWLEQEAICENLD